MSTITVFYANRIYLESNHWVPTIDLPDGAFIRDAWAAEPRWYVVQFGTHVPIEWADLPKSLKALLLLIS